MQPNIKETKSLRTFSEPPQTDMHERFRGRLTQFVLLIFPLITFVVLLIGMLAVGMTLLKARHSTQTHFEPINLEQNNLNGILLKNYIAANGGMDALQEVSNSSLIQFSGIIKNYGDVHAFEGTIDSQENLHISFIDKNIVLNFPVHAGRIDRSVDDVKYLTDPSIASLICVVSDLFNPLDEIAMGGEGEILSVERVIYEKSYALLVHITNPARGVSTDLYLDEESMHVLRKVETFEDDVQRDFTYSNYRKVNSTNLPFIVNVDVNQGSLPPVQFLRITPETHVDPNLIFPGAFHLKDL